MPHTLKNVHWEERCILVVKEDFDLIAVRKTQSGLSEPLTVSIPHTHIQTHTYDIHTHTYDIHTYRHTHRHTRIHRTHDTRTDTQAHTDTHTRQTHMHTHTHHTHRHTHRHTHMHRTYEISTRCGLQVLTSVD